MTPGKAKMWLYNGSLKLDEASLKKVFLLQLGNILCIKNYLIDNLPTMAETASFFNLKHAILETIDDIKLQILRMEVMYDLLEETYQPQHCIGIRALMMEGYAKSKSNDLSGLETDMMMLYHLNAVGNVEVSCFKFIADLAASLPNEGLTLLIRQNLDSAKDNKALYEMIAQEYIN